MKKSKAFDRLAQTLLQERVPIQEWRDLIWTSILRNAVDKDDEEIAKCLSCSVKVVQQRRNQQPIEQRLPLRRRIVSELTTHYLNDKQSSEPVGTLGKTSIGELAEALQQQEYDPLRALLQSLSDDVEDLGFGFYRLVREHRDAIDANGLPALLQGDEDDAQEFAAARDSFDDLVARRARMTPEERRALLDERKRTGALVGPIDEGALDAGQVCLDPADAVRAVDACWKQLMKLRRPESQGGVPITILTALDWAKKPLALVFLATLLAIGVVLLATSARGGAGVDHIATMLDWKTLSLRDWKTI